jgi:hypothetical protein
MILTHGVNSLLKSEPIPDFLFYTDFGNYNAQTQIDTPLVGSLGEYNENIGMATQTTGGPFGKKYGTIRAGYSFPNVTQRYHTITTKYVPQYITSEIWIKTYYAASAYFGLGFGHQLLTLDYECVPLLIIRDLDNAVINFYNGATKHSASNGKYLYVDTNVNANSIWRHVATVDTSTDTYLYVAGVLYCSITKQTSTTLPMSNIAIILNGTGSSSITNVGYWSFRVGDYATPNHQSFPVPTNPYL